MKKPVPIENLDAAQARREHARLGEDIAAHDRRYYTEDAPTMPAMHTTLRQQRYV
jgi:DNA ligase (NAD+)